MRRGFRELGIVFPFPSSLAPPFSLFSIRSSSSSSSFSYQTPSFSCSSSSSAAAVAAAMGSQDVEWPAKRVRDTFIKFFEDKNHVHWKSSPVVPLNDPTLLFANAGLLNSSFIYVCFSRNFFHFVNFPLYLQIPHTPILIYFIFYHKILNLLERQLFCEFSILNQWYRIFVYLFGS